VISSMRNGKVYRGSTTNTLLVDKRGSNGQNTCVPQDVQQSKAMCVKKHQKDMTNPSRKVTPLLECIFLSNSPNSGANNKQNIRECENPRWYVRARKSSRKYCERTSKSGMVPAIAPQSKARLPIFFPIVSSAIDAPSTICERESILNHLHILLCKGVGKS
jgi:hypothetical protein